VRSPSADALGQVVDDHTGSGVGSVRDCGTVEQASAIAGGADGERFALFVIWVFALCVALLDRFDALDASECRLFDLSRDGTADTVDRALRRLAFEDRRSEGQGYECSEGGELHVGMN